MILTDFNLPHNMHVAVFIYAMTGGGAQRRTLTLIKNFLGRGHQVDLVVVEPSGALHAEIQAAVRCVPLKSLWVGCLPSKGLGKLKPFCCRRALADYLSQHRPDVLLSAASHTSPTALDARRLSGTGTPLVLRLSNHLTASHAGALNLFNRMRYLTACRWFAEADAVIAVSAAIAEDIAQNTGVARHRIRTNVHWRLGQVVDDVQAELAKALERAFDSHPEFLGRQQEAFAYTFYTEPQRTEAQ